MDTMKLLGLVEKVESIFTKIKYMRSDEQLVSPNKNQLNEIKQALNELFVEYNGGPTCIDVIYTRNDSNEFFGVYVNPMFNFGDAISILATEDPVVCRQYQLEIESGLLDMDLDADEITAIVLHEISAMLCNPQVLNDVRALIDMHVLVEDDVIRIRDSVNYSQLLLYALKDTYYKVSSLMFKEDIEEVTGNALIQAAELADAIESGQEKLINNVYGMSDTVRSPKVIILKWAFMLYKDVQHNSRLSRETLTDAKDFTASILVKQEIDKTLTALDRIDASTVLEGVSLNKVFEKKALHSLNEASLFKSLKQSGLKSIENDYYELAIKAKAMECEDDAIFLIRAINTRLGILEDYIYNTELSDAESRKWNGVLENYRNLREFVAKSKVFKKKSYGLFFDYNQLDQVDESFALEPVRESIFSKNVKIPKDVMDPMSKDLSIWQDTAKCKKQIDTLFKYLIDNKAPEKQISYNCKRVYYYILGNTFADGIASSINHGDTVTYLCSKYAKKYASDKDKATIKKDIDNTVDALNKLESSGKDLTKLQEQWRADIVKAVKYL